MPPAPMSSNHTRNLIGMNAVNACRLNDLDGKAGFWFVLQDLSVRTEGTFRLKLSLFDIGSGTNTVVPESQGPTHGKGPCLAHSFSEQFTVYSAKKFPGVIESTPLSKCFAQQGIKIPIRKDAPKEIVNANEYEADD
ncbi:Velvet domain containing protein [Pyrenophora tritici-repentis]|nr:Velvet domain containing protein [Pyrenophora tritici-repentis]KAF7564138.1 Velvet domain containing protein [Pyrenophora tritici-repentis]KAF7564140.1 Velvet domain containing protein [Pyrenophora tritici-repentis]KAG9389424.1 Velvet domain containing protein [Pyrenophora tritici-repentis]